MRSAAKRHDEKRAQLDAPSGTHVEAATADHGSLTSAVLLQLQGAAGNAAVSRLLSRQDAAPPPAAPPATPTAPLPQVNAASAGAGVAAKVHEELAAKQRELEQTAADGESSDDRPTSKEEALAKVDRGELGERRAELHATAQAEAPDPLEHQGAAETAAAGVKTAADTDAGKPSANQPKGPAKGAVGGSPHEGALSAAGAAAALAEQAYAAAEQPEPDVPAPLIPPEPVVPVDAGGAPLPPLAGGDAPVLAIAARAQTLRDQGYALRVQAAGERGNAAIIRGNIAQAQAGVTQAEGAITSSKQGLEQRRAIAGQARVALSQSEEKAQMVAEKAPELAATADEKKADSAQMAGDAGALSGRAASTDPDDEEAAQKSKEQSGELGKAGSDIGSVDQTFGQTGERAHGFAAEAVQARAANTQTSAKIQETEVSVQQTDARLSDLGAQNSAAKARLAAFQHQPAVLESQANEIDTQGQALIDASQEIGARLAAAQARHTGELSSVPAVEPATSGGSAGVGGTLARQEMSYGERWNANLGQLATNDLPEALTGEERPSEAERQRRLAAEQKRKAEELAAINAMCDGHFERASAGDKALMALRLTGHNLWSGVGETKWPQFVGNLARGLIDPRVSLMGVVSGYSMAISGVANLANVAAWKADPLGNLLKSAADIATGIAIILGSIVGLATAIIAIMWALAIVTFGFLGPAAAAVTPFCTTVIGTVFPWTLIAAKWALALQALCFIKNLAEAATSKTAADLQTNTEQMTEDAKQGGAMAATIVVAKGMEVGGRALANTAVGQRVAGGVQSVGEWANISAPPAPAAGTAATVADAAAAPPAAPAAETTTGAPASSGSVEAPVSTADAAPSAPPSQTPVEAPAPSAANSVPTDATGATPSGSASGAAPDAPVATPVEGTPAPAEPGSAAPTMSPEDELAKLIAEQAADQASGDVGLTDVEPGAARVMDLPEYQNGVSTASEIFEKLPDIENPKNIASGVEGDPKTSGWAGEKIEATERAQAEGVEAGHETDPHFRDPAGGEGQYESSHSERQRAAGTSDQHFGSSKELCPACQQWFAARAGLEGRPQFVADPSGVHVFTPEGSHWVEPHPSGAVTQP